MPVLIIGTYDDNQNANAMNAAWGGVYDEGKIEISLAESHKTTKNIKLNEAFTVSFGDEKNIKACDYVGIVSGNDEPDKLKKAGFSTKKSEFVNAPVILELPVTLECKLVKFTEDGNVIGEIVNVNADESVLDENGSIDTQKLRAISLDAVHGEYLVLGEKVGNAFKDGKSLIG